MVAGVVRGRGVGAALPLLGAQRAEQRRGVEDGGGGDDEPQHDQPVHHVVSECDSVTGAYLHGNSHSSCYYAMHVIVELSRKM